MPAPMTSGFFDAADGMKLYGEWYAPPAAVRGGAVVLHGRSDHCGRYQEVGRRLAALGFATLAFDYRGHGQAGGRRGHCDRFDDYLGDLERAADRVRDTVGDRPVLLVGHSHGALIALRSLCEPRRMPAAVAAAVLASPVVGLKARISPWRQLAGRLMSPAWPRFPLMSAIDPARVSHDPDVVAARASDRYCHKLTTARWWTESAAVQDYVRRHVGRVAIPTLWLLGEDDQIADVGAALRAYGRAGGDKHLVTYPGFFHELFHEKDRERVFHDMEAWLFTRFPAA